MRVGQGAFVGEVARPNPRTLLRQLELWLAATNTYVVAPAPNGPAVVVDAPPGSDRLIELLAAHDLIPVALLVTHGHVDHVGGAGELATRTGVTTYLHPADDYMARHPSEQLRYLFGQVLPGDFEAPEHFLPLEDGLLLDLAGLSFEVLATPGHTPGHCCFYLPEQGMLFAGDHLMAGTIGRTDLPGGDFEILMRSMDDKVLPLDDEVSVLPGHGPRTTVGRERRNNPYLVGRR